MTSKVLPIFYGAYGTAAYHAVDLEGDLLPIKINLSAAVAEVLFDILLDAWGAVDKENHVTADKTAVQQEGSKGLKAFN